MVSLQLIKINEKKKKLLGTGASETLERRFNSPRAIGELRKSIRVGIRPEEWGVLEPRENVGVTRHQIVLRDHKRRGLKTDHWIF